jgi:glycosyltransferase involved in cell wall biosynthesis
MNFHACRVSLVIGSFRIGGAEMAFVNLANGFYSRGVKVEVVCLEKTGELLSRLHGDPAVYSLEKKHARSGIFAFVKYLKEKNPDVLIVAQLHIQLMVMMSRLLSGWKGKIILNEQSTFSSNNKNYLFKFLASLLFRPVNAVTAVSRGAMKDLSNAFPFLKNRIRVVYNPVYSPAIMKLKDELVLHPFIAKKKCPVILAAGRLTSAKNYALLISAFSEVVKVKQAKLIILGEGEGRPELEEKIRSLSLSEDVSLPGNATNPWAFMNGCDVFVLSSLYEGLPSVLIEALACGCNIVSVDCPHGPAEILDNGKYGMLVPVNDGQAMATAILKSISTPDHIEGKKEQAEKFSIEKITNEYLKLIDELKNAG